MFDLTGKAALVTGASGGIGGAIARGLHAQGATVVLTGTRAAALEELAKSLGDRTHVIVSNLSDPAEADKLMAAAEAAAGKIDILVNNAGITRDMLSMRMKDEDWQAVIDVNLTAAFRLSRAAIRNMIKRRAGRIISITSIVGTTGNPGQANYAAAKAGMVGMSKSLAAEVASRNITVNCVAPGFIETAMTDKLNDQQKERIKGAIPAGRIGQPAEVAGAVVFLASDEAGYLTGQTLHVNGGMAMI
jgi:3-oxoacyl-[acyl-carrier protein] reductase